LTSIIEKRKNLHKSLTDKQQQNDKLQYEMGQLQALANIGTVTCMIAHEINNLLTPLPNYATLALQHPDDLELTKKALEKAVTNCQRASMVMESILTVANGQSDEKTEVLLGKLVDEIFSCLCRDFSKDSITVQIDIADDLKVFAIPIQIQQVLMNLIINARDAMAGRGGVLRIKAYQVNNGVRIEVADSGCGIEAKNQEYIFEPFFSTKKDKASSSGGGYGLGLAFCKKVIDEHNGLIEVDSEPGQGCKFTITLPGR